VEATSARAAATDNVPPDLLEKLGALGYVSPGRSSDTASSGADPKDKLEEYKALNTEMRQGLIALREKRPHDAAGHFHRLLDFHVDSFEVHYYLGRALSGLHQWKDAAAHYEKAVEKLPSYGPAYVALVESRLATGDARGALAAAKRGQEAAPKEPRLFEREADILRLQGNVSAAADVQQKVVTMAPSDAMAKIRLGEMRRDLGRVDDAIQLMREALAIDAGPASYWNSLGMVLGGAGRLDEAERAFAEASTRDPNDPQYAYNRALALQRLGRTQDAQTLFRRAAELGFGPARERLEEPRRRGGR
jgi:tetratricopeptide (TPR) repeat protein